MNFLHIGPKLPFNLSRSTIVTSPNGQGVMLIGGYGNNVTDDIFDYVDVVLELTAKPFMKWKILEEQKLKYPRCAHVTIPIRWHKTK